MAGEQDRLLTVFEAHGAALYALFIRLTLRADVAEDLLQELFLKLQKAEGFAHALDPKAYAFRVALNLSCDWRRARRLTEPLLEEPAAVAELPIERLIDAEELGQILEALPSLSELNREVLVLRYLQHEEVSEIGRRLGKTDHQVRGLCSKALAQLRTIMGTPAQRSDKGGKP